LAGVLQEVVTTCAAATHRLSLTAETVRISVHATSDQLTQGLTRNTAPYLTLGPPAQQNASTAVVQVAVNNDLAGRLTDLAASAGPADSARGTSRRSTVFIWLTRPPGLTAPVRRHSSSGATPRQM